MSDDQAVIDLLAQRNQLRLLVYLKGARQADHGLLARVLGLGEVELETLTNLALKGGFVQMLGQGEMAPLAITLAGEGHLAAHFEALARAIEDIDPKP